MSKTLKLSNKHTLKTLANQISRCNASKIRFSLGRCQSLTLNFIRNGSALFTSDILSVIKKKLYAWEKFVFSKNIIRPKWYFSYRKWNVLDTISNKNTDCRVDLWQFTLRSLHILVKNGTYFQFFMIKWYSKTSFFPDNKSWWRIFRANGKKGNKS